MAVNYASTDTYTTYKNNANSNLKQAHKDDRKEWHNGILNRTTQMTSFGSSIGSIWGGVGTGVGALIGGGLGVLIGLFEQGNYNENYLSEIANLNNDIATYTSTAASSQKNRNSLINNVDYYINQSTSSFTSTYGKNAFTMLESTIQSILDMDKTTSGQKKLSELLGGLKQDTIIGDIETRLLNTDLKDDKGNAVTGRIDYNTLLNMNTKYLDISSLGQMYVESLYNAVFNSDTEIGDAAKQISDEQEYALAESDEQFASIVISNQEKFAELFLNARSSNISNAESIGETEAASGSSGIKASKASRTNANATKLKADISNASYAIMLKSYKQSVKASIDSGNLSRSKAYYSTQQQINTLKRQLKTSIGESINNYFHTGTSAALEIGEEERNTDEAMATVQSAKDVITDHGETPNETLKYIYTTSTATK